MDNAVSLSTVKPDGGGLRYDEGKDRWDLLPWDAIEVLVKIFTHGAKKYAPRNWERGMPWSQVVGPLWRHFIKRFVRGELLDEESGQLHTAHLAWNALALLTYDLRKIGTDDVTLSNPVPPDSSPTANSYPTGGLGRPPIGVGGGSSEGGTGGGASGSLPCDRCAGYLVHMKGCPNNPR